MVSRIYHFAVIFWWTAEFCVVLYVKMWEASLYTYYIFGRHIVKRLFLGRMVALIALVGSGVGSGAANWEQWRGPSRDGKLSGFVAPAKWPQQLTRKWRIEVGVGHSSPLVNGDMAFVLSRQGDTEYVRGFRLSNGQRVWERQNPAPFNEQIYPARNHPKGPFATPVYWQGRLYTLGVNNLLHCFDAKTGNILWKQDLGSAFQPAAPLFGASSSPLIEQGVLVVHAGNTERGQMMALDAKTGKILWKTPGEGPGYASPVVTTLLGTKVIVAQGQKSCVGYDFKSGKLLWSMNYPGTLAHNSITPIIAGDKIIYGGNFRATFAAKVSKTGDAWKIDKAWETRDVTFSTSTAVVVGYRMYGFSERRRGQMFSLDLNTGKTLWMNDGGMGENAILYDAGGLLLTFNNDANLYVWQPRGDTLTQVAKYQVAESPVWASPAVVGNRLLIKDEKSLTLWEIPSK
jgi:outer membrane protein assembly factor BamB